MEGFETHNLATKLALPYFCQNEDDVACTESPRFASFDEVLVVSPIENKEVPVH